MLPYELTRLQKLGFPVFTGTYNLNFVGVRTSNVDQTTSPKDDYFMMIYQDTSGAWITESFPGTTDPTAAYLKNPINPKGTAILVDGKNYPKLWVQGLHGPSKKPALVQHSTCSVYRDGNRNLILDFDPSTIDVGLFGINFHQATGSYSSAGCQTVEKQEWVDRVRALVDAQIKAGYGETLSYTLVKEHDLYPAI